MTDATTPKIPFRAQLDEAKLLENPGLRAPRIPLELSSAAKISALRAWIDGLIQNNVILGLGRRKAERGFACHWAATVGPAEAARGAMALVSIALEVWSAEKPKRRSEEWSTQERARWARSHALLIAFDVLTALPPESNWCGEEGSAMAMQLLRQAVGGGLKIPGQHQEKHEAIELSCAMACVSSSLGKAEFKELLLLSQPRPLKALLEAEKVWRPVAAEAAAMALAAAKDLASGRLWAIVELSRLSKLAATAANGEEFGLPLVDIEVLRKALEIACALGAERSVANLLCSWAKPSPALLKACAWSSLGMTPLGRAARDGIEKSFGAEDCPYTSPADGAAGSCLAQIHGRPVGALLSRAEWSLEPQMRRELARDIARQALAEKNEGLFQLGFFHGEGPRPSDLPAAIAKFGQKKIAMWEARIVAGATVKEAVGGRTNTAEHQRPRL